MPSESALAARSGGTAEQLELFAALKIKIPA